MASTIWIVTPKLLLWRLSWGNFSYKLTAPGKSHNPLVVGWVDHCLPRVFCKPGCSCKCIDSFCWTSSVRYLWEIKNADYDGERLEEKISLLLELTWLVQGLLHRLEFFSDIQTFLTASLCTRGKVDWHYHFHTCNQARIFCVDIMATKSKSRGMLKGHKLTYTQQRSHCSFLSAMMHNSLGYTRRTWPVGSRISWSKEQ